MKHTLMPCSGSRQDFAVEMRERISEGVSPLVGTGRCRRIDVDVVRDEELLEHLPGSDQEITVAALAAELERALHRRFGSRAPVHHSGCLHVRHDDDLEVPLDAFGKCEEVGR